MQIKFKNLSISFSGKDVIRDVSLDIKSGEKVFIIGSTGAGKSTLLNSITNPKIISSGDVYIDNNNIKKLSRRAMLRLNSQYGLLSQEDILIPWETVFTNIKNMYPIYKNWFYKLFNFISKDGINKIRKIARELEIEEILYKKTSDISGGERQRVNLLILLLKKTSLILADEPSTSLDIERSRKIVNRLFDLKDATVIINIHKIDIIPNNANRVIAISKGAVFFDGPITELNKEKIKEIYE